MLCHVTNTHLNEPRTHVSTGFYRGFDGKHAGVGEGLTAQNLLKS